MLAGETVGAVFRISVGQSIIGRSLDADVRLDDEGVSRRHAKILRDPDGSAKLVDLHSTNGTFINGRRISAEGLREGDRVRIGWFATLDFRFEYDDSDLPPTAESDAPRQRSRSGGSDQLEGGYDNLAATLDSLGKVYTAQGEHGAAISAYRRTLQIREMKFGREHPAVAAILDSLGVSLQGTGEHAEARACHRRALEIYQQQARPPRETGHVLAHLGTSELALGEPRAALRSLTSGLDLLREHGATSTELARVRFSMARTLHRLGKQRERMVDLAKLARDAFAAGGSSMRELYDEVDAWLMKIGED